MNYKVAILPILICLLSSCCFQHRTNKASSEASPAESVNETETPITSKEFHVRYDKPINGYTVTAVIEPYEDADWGPTVLTFTKGDISFSVYVDSFTKEGFSLKGYDASEEVVLQYSPKPKGVMLYSKEPFCFSDVDFDGTEEILVLDYGQGVHGVNAYRVFEPNGKRREDAPFKELDDHYEFDAAQKTIAYKYFEDPETGPFNDIYKRHKDGSFELIKERVPVK